VVFGSFWFWNNHVAKSESNTDCDEDSSIEGHNQKHNEGTSDLHQEKDQSQLDSKNERLMDSDCDLVSGVGAKVKELTAEIVHTTSFLRGRAFSLLSLALLCSACWSSGKRKTEPVHTSERSQLTKDSTT